MSTPPEKAKPSRKRRWMFRLIAVLLGLCPFIILEILLRILNIGAPTQFDDPFVGFSNIHPLFELHEDEGKYITAPSRQLYFGKQEWVARKPENGFRAFCLGGSTVRGRPHETSTSFCKWLEIELRGQDPSREHQVINCGGVSYAGYRLRPILDEVLGYDPDLIVLATGHNEFLEDRTYQELKSQSETRRRLTDQLYSLRTVTLVRQLFSGKEKDQRPVLPADVEARLDDTSGYASYHRDDQWWEDVLRHYRTTVERMVIKCKEKNVPVILVLLGSNLRDCPPFKSEHRPGLSSEARQQWQTAFDLATREEQAAILVPDAKESGLLKAMAYYRQAEEIDDEHGLLLFRMARCLERLGKTAEAREYYVKAKEWDVCPLRMKEEMTTLLEEIAETHQVPLVRAREAIESLAPHSIPGFDYYIDHVHPTIGSHQLIAQLIMNEMRQQNMLAEGARTWNAKQRREAYRQHFEELPRNFLAGGKERIRWLERWARRQDLAEETVPVDAHGYFRLGIRQLEIDREEDALKDFTRALAMQPSVEEELLNRVFQLIQEGRPQSARVIANALLQSEDVRENRKNHYLVLLVLAVQQGKKSEAIRIRQQYEEAPEPKRGLSEQWLSLVSETLTRFEG